MNEPRQCPQCAAEIPANSPAGLCPRCLLLAANDSQSGAASEPGPTVLTQPAPASGFVPPTPEELAPLFPQLEILELLGKGGMGAVYKARQPGLDRLVAVKILPSEISRDPAFAERFQREARALAKLSHPHIVAVYDFGQTGGLCYIVMEFVDGANLRQAMRTGKLTSQEALAIVPQICEALQFAHDEGIVHRDIKPENILIDKRGRVKIADFGLAKLLGQDASDHSLTATHQVMGTLRYMAPEQMQGSRAVDHRADIYSLGVVFYELLTGELPMGKFAPPSKRVQIDVRLDEVVLRTLEQDPELRYQHASEVKSEIDSIRTTPAPPKPVEQRDPLEPFREVARFTMTPNPSYAKRVGIPMAILLGLFSMVTIAAHSVYGQKDNYQEQPLVLILSNGAILFWVAVAILHITFFARRRVSMKATPTPSPDPVRPEVRQQDAKEILSLLLSGLYCMSIAGWGLAFYGGARVLVDGTMPGTRRDVLAFGWCLAGSIVAQVVLHKGWTQGRDRLARLGALNLVAVGGLLSNVSSRWCSVPSWVALIYSLVAFVGYLILRGKDVSAALRDRANQTRTPRMVSIEPRFSRFAIAGAVWAIFGLLTVIPVLYFIGLNRVWNGTALPTDVIHSEPPLVFTIFMGALLAIGAGAPIGTTIYGAIAIGRIKRSGGKIIGLPLAVADAIFFALLIVFGAIAVGLALALHSLFPIQLVAAGVPATIVAAIVCFFIGRAMWRTIAGVAPRTSTVTPADSSEPHLSHLALWGAFWAGLGLLGLIVAVFLTSLSTSGPSGQASPPPESLRILGLVVVSVAVALGLSSVFGTTICGAVAIGHIKHSAGKLYGLWLAAAAALLFPLLVLGGITFTLTHFTLITVWTNWPGSIATVQSPDSPPPRAYPGEVFMILDAIAALVVCFFVGRAVWRAVAEMNSLGDQLRGTPVEETSGANSSNGIGRISLWAAISGVVLPALLLLGGIMLSSRVSIPDGFVAVCFLLGVGLELVAVGCGIVARSTKSGKAGLIIGSIAIVLWLATLWMIPTRTRVSMDGFQLETITEANSATRTLATSLATDSPIIEELFTLKGHTGYVYNVRFSPDGSRIASASHDGTAKVWNAETGDELFTCRGHTDYVHGLAYSPDGMRLATTSQDGSVRIWDAETGEEKLRVTDRGVSNLAFSPDGERIVSAGNQNKALVWNATTGEEILTLKGDDTSVFFNVAYSPDGKWIAASGMDGAVWLWDAATGREADIHRNAISILRGLAFDRESTRIAACTADGHVRVWDVSSGELLVLIKMDGDSPLCVTFSPDGKWLANGTTNGDIRIWHAAKETPGYMPGHYREVLSLKAHPRMIKSVVFSPDGYRLASASDDKTVKVWKLTR